MIRSAVWICLLLCPALDAAEPLHKRIDALIETRAIGHQLSPQADDAEFVRRLYLDFAGRIPTVAETRAFLADRKIDKRAQLIDRLQASPEYARRMCDAFHVMLMERLGDSPEWLAWLENAFAKNRPWDRLAREMLEGKNEGEAKGATFWLAKRLENYGQNPVDYAGLTRDIGRLFLGVDLRCAECHDHLHIEDYKQRDFQGLYAFVRNAFLAGKPPAWPRNPPAAPWRSCRSSTRNRSPSGPSCMARPRLPCRASARVRNISRPPTRGPESLECSHSAGVARIQRGDPKNRGVTYPYFTSACVKLLPQNDSGLPPYVWVKPGGGFIPADAGFLGPKYGTLALGDGKPPKGLLRPSDISDQENTERNQLRKLADQRYARQRRTENTEANSYVFDMAEQLQKRQDLFDTSKFNPRDVQRYGTHEFGRHMLLARKLLESGVAVVKVNSYGWDTHGDNFNGHHNMVPKVDLVISSALKRVSLHAP